ncbi:MAG TPA: cytochrome c oxidase assembly protein [Acidimicrobiales bacterium]|nr:cytochrome c oxidase assembly protein [Acidimicrobiales bacterium]
MKPDPWQFHAHPEVWLLVAGIIGFAVYAVKVIGPKAVRDGSPIVTTRQKLWFVLAVVTMWIAADWPVHDIGERYLYFVHMFQHLLLTMVVAPLFLLATPTWLARLIVGEGWFAGKFIRNLCRPVVAAVLFNAAFVFVHYPPTVNASATNGALHFGLHVLIMSTAMIMWMCVCGPLPELRISLPGQMIYLFCQSIVPTVPSAWLIFAEKPLYRVYDTAYRFGNIDAISDQQTAGVLMKLGGGIFLWAVIFVLFFKWAARHEEAERQGVLVTEHDVLTWDTVKAELDELEKHSTK